MAPPSLPIRVAAGDKDQNPPCQQCTSKSKNISEIAQNYNNTATPLKSKLNVCTYLVRSLKSTSRLAEFDLSLEKLNLDKNGISEVKLEEKHIIRNDIKNTTFPKPSGPRGKLDHHPLSNNNKSTKPKKHKENILKICTYNVRSLSSTEKYLELSYALENIHYDVIGLSEVRRMGCNIEEYNDCILCYIGQTKGLYGVGFLIKRALKNNITNFTGISERVALLQLKFENLNLSIIQVYAPTKCSSDEEIKKLYNDLAIAHDLADEKVLVIGDFNAKIGQPKTGEHPVMGKYGYGVRNVRGTKLVEYAFEYKLSIMNTYFKKKPNKKWTWESPDHKHRSEIDFIMTNTPKLVTNFEILNNINFSSDHRFLRATVRLRVPKKSRMNFKSYPNTLLTENDINSFTNNLKSYKFEKKSEELIDVQDYYDTIEQALTSSSTLNYTGRKLKKQNIFSVSTVSLIKRRTELISTKNKTKEMKKELGQIFKQTNKEIKKDYKMHRQAIITQNIAKLRSTKRAFKELTLHKKWIQKLETKTNETKSRKDIIDQATNFYKELYKKRHQEKNIVDTANYIPNTESIPPIEAREVYEHIKLLKSGKSPGPDRISNEMLKHATPILLNHFTQLFNLILETETVPKQWCSSDIILLYKKGNPLDVGNYRPISLMTSLYKLFASIILKRISSDINEAQPIEQAGFRPGYSTTDHLQSLEQVIEKYKEFRRPLYIAFIDYSKAFDSISHNSIWNALSSLNTNIKYINILKYIYTNATSRVKLETRGEKIRIERGVRQGDPLSPKLFIAVLESVFKKLDWKNKGLNIGGVYLSHLRFADDIVVLAETPRELEIMIHSLDEESARVGLEMNASKTKIITNSQRLPISSNGNFIEYVDKYIYLGKQVSFNKSNNEEEVERRCKITWNKFWSLREILKGDYTSTIKKTVIDTCLLPSLLYGCQTWVYTRKVKEKIRSTQRSMERSTLNIRKIHKIRSEIIRQKTKVTDALTQALRLKWQWAGHISRLKDNRWTTKVTCWKGPLGKRSIGKPTKRWADDIVKKAGQDWMILARDRGFWKEKEEAFTQSGSTLQDNN